MEVRIGVQHAPRELTVETFLTPDEVHEALAKALGTSDGLFTLKSERGQRVVVPVEKLAYIEIGESEPRRVGFATD